MIFMRCIIREYFLSIFQYITTEKSSKCDTIIITIFLVEIAILYKYIQNINFLNKIFEVVFLNIIYDTKYDETNFFPKNKPKVGNIFFFSFLGLSFNL